MRAVQTIEMLKTSYVTDNFHFPFTAAMLLAGNGNKNLRQEIIKELTGQEVPKSKAGLRNVVEALENKFKTN